MSPRVVVCIMIAGAFFCAMMAAALAQQPPGACGPLPAFIKFLEARYNQFRVLDLELKGGKLVIARSKEGTWTILKVEGQDAACIFAVGKASIVDRGV